MCVVPPRCHPATVLPNVFPSCVWLSRSPDYQHSLVTSMCVRVSPGDRLEDPARHAGEQLVIPPCQVSATDNATTGRGIILSLEHAAFGESLKDFVLRLACFPGAPLVFVCSSSRWPCSLYAQAWLWGLRLGKRIGPSAGHECLGRTRCCRFLILAGTPGRSSP